MLCLRATEHASKDPAVMRVRQMELVRVYARDKVPLCEGNIPRVFAIEGI